MKCVLGEMHWRRTSWINRPKEQVSEMLTNGKSNPSSWVQKELDMKPVHFQTPVFSNQSNNALIKATSNPDSLHITQGSWLFCLCPPSVLPHSPFYEQTGTLCVQPLSVGEQEPGTVSLLGWRWLVEAHLYQPKISHLWWHRPFCQHLLHAGWNIIWLRPGGATFFLQIRFPVTRGCFQVLNRQPRPLTALCWHHHSASSCSLAGGSGGPSGCFPVTNSCKFPSREEALVPGPMQWHLERPEAKQQNWEEGIIAGIRTVEKTTGRKTAMRDRVGNGREVGVMEKEWKRKLWEEQFNHFVDNTGYLSQDFNFSFFFIFQLWSELLQKNCFIVVCLPFPIYEPDNGH